MHDPLFRLDQVHRHDPAIDAWFAARPHALGAIARRWFEEMRRCGDEVCETIHDGCPVACFGNCPFAYVNVFTAHVSVGFFRGASLPDPARLLQGSGRRMRHVKLRSNDVDIQEALTRLIQIAYHDLKTQVEAG